MVCICIGKVGRARTPFIGAGVQLRNGISSIGHQQSKGLVFSGSAGLVLQPATGAKLLRLRLQNT